MGSMSVPEQLQAGAQLLWTPGGIHELRVVDGPRAPISGYFDDAGKLAAAAALLDGKAPAVCMTLNPVAPALLARAHNRVQERAKKTTGDDWIAARSWLPLDFDPHRPSDTSSSEEEHEAALRRAVACGKWLVEIGLPRAAIVFADSGNGAHLLLRIDLPNDADSTRLVERCTEAVAQRFGDEVIDVDLTVSTAARIWKIYGTLAAKGDSIPERPHRRSQLRIVPDNLQSLTREEVELLARFAPAEPERNERTHTGDFSIDAFVQRHFPDTVVKAGPWKGGRIWVLDVCPFNPEHTDRSACITHLPGTGFGFRCHHSSCQGLGWQALRAKVEPKAERHDYQPVQSGSAAQTYRNGNHAKGPAVPKLTRLQGIERKKVAFHWYPYLPAGYLTLFDGDPGVRKSWLVGHVTVCATRGWKLPGDEREGAEPFDVLYLAGEEGLDDAVVPRLEDMGADLGRVTALECKLRDGQEEMLIFDTEGLAVLEEAACRVRPQLVVIDPLLAYLGSEIDDNKAGQVRAVLRPLGDLARKFGFTLACTRHLSKAITLSALQRGQGSMQFAAVARSQIGVALDPDDRDYSAMVHIKPSFTEPGASRRFALNPSPSGTILVWDERNSSLTGDELFGPGENSGDSYQEARTLLERVLFNARVPSKEVENMRRELNIPENAMRRAKRDLGVEWDRQMVPQKPGIHEVVLYLPVRPVTPLQIVRPPIRPLDGVRHVGDDVNVDNCPRDAVQGDLPHEDAKNDEEQASGKGHVDGTQITIDMPQHDPGNPLTNDLTRDEGEPF